MARPSIPISDRDTFIKAAKSSHNNAVRIGRTWTSVVVKEGEGWFDRPAIRFYYEVDVDTMEGPMTWTYAEVIQLDEDGRLKGTSLQALLQSERVPSEIMRTQSGSL